MMDNNHLAKLSVIVLIPDDSCTNERTLAHLSAQTVADQIEIVMVAPENVLVNECHLDLSHFHAVNLVRVADMTSNNAARAAGVRAASAPIVALAEDHSFPEPDWAEILIAAHDGPWAAVGPAFVNANPRHPVGWANLAIEYAPWLDPVASGMAEHLPGHNSSYKRQVLLEYGDELEEMLEAESVLHWDLRAKGHRLYVEARAKTHHLNYTLLRWALLLRFLGGRGFAAARSRKWGVPKRLFYGLCSPLLPLRRGPGIWKALQRTGQLRRFKLQMMLLLPLLLGADALGEMCGYLFGAGRTLPRLNEMEFKRKRFMKKDDHPLTTRQSEPAELSVR